MEQDRRRETPAPDPAPDPEQDPAPDPAQDPATLVQIRERFSHDRFATDACGCTVEEARRGHAVCAFDIAPHHRNALGAVMGGAVFTLADFALAVASNVDDDPAVSVSNTIEFLASTRGARLTAICDADKSGRSLAFYTVVVRDDLGVTVARMSATCYRIRGR